MSALDEVKEYLGTTLAGDYGDAVLSSVIEVETAEQGNRVRAAYRLTILDDWNNHPSPLREAIKRRVVRNLAMRRLPLGISESDVAALRIGSRDAEISRLEGPYKRLSVG